MSTPFHDFKDIHGTSPATITNAAHTPGVHAKQLSQLGKDLLQDASRSDANITGDLKQISQVGRTAAGHAQNLAAAGQLASGGLLKFGAAGTDFDAKVRKLNEQVANAANHRGSGKAKVDPAQLRKNKEAQLRPTYNGYVADLDRAAHHTATMITTKPGDPRYLGNIKTLIREGFIPLSAAGDWPHLVLTTGDKQQYYQSIFSRMSTAQQIAWVNKNKDHLPPEAAPGLDPSVQQHFADQVAGAIKADGVVNADTVKLMTFFQNAAPYAHELFSKVSPRDLASEIESFNGDLFCPGSTAGKGELDLYKTFLTTAGHTLATYSNATGAYAPPGGASHLADDWFAAITSGDHKADGAALTLMIRAGGQNATYNAHFLGNLTGKTYEWELHQDKGTWSDRNTYGTDYAYRSIVNPFLNDPEHNEYVTGPVPYSAGDGLANLLGGMAHSPEAAQNFFLGHYPGSTQGLDDRMNYLIGGEHGRTWDGMDGSDDGDGLGLALQAATVGQDSRTADGTDIANKLFQNIAKYGGNADSNTALIFENHKWHVGPQMTDSLGQIAAGYSGDLYDMLSNTPPDHGATHLNISQGDLTKVLGEIGGSKDHTGLETLTTAMMLQTRNENVSFLHSLHGPHTLENLLKDPGYQGLQDTNGDVMGNLLHYGTSMWSDDDKNDQARAAMMSKAIGVAAGFVPGAGSVLGEGASDLAKMTYDTVKSTSLAQIQDAVAHSAPSTAAQYMNNATDKLPTQLQLNAVADLYRTGYLGAQDTGHGPHYAGVSPNLFTHGDPPSIQPGLYDGDGYSLKNSHLSPSQQQAVLNAWRDLKDDPSEVWDIIKGATYTGSFYDQVQHPTPMAGG